MRILQVLPGATARIGGVPAFVGGAARELARLGAEVPVLTTDLALAPHGLWQARQRAARRDELHPDLAGGDVRVFAARAPRRLGHAPALGRAVRAEAARADVVHIHNLWLFPQFAAFRAALAAGTPYVVSPHGSLDPYLRRKGRARKRLTLALWQQELLDRAALMHVTTEAERDLVADVSPHVPRVVVPCGIRFEAFAGPAAPGAFRERHLGGDDRPLVLFLGRVTARKGLDVLVRAFAAARVQGPCRLAVVGPDDEDLLPALRRLVAELALEDDVTFTGPLFGADRLDALAAADVWALPSHTENFGIAVVEAMAAGRPVVLSPAVNLAPEVAAAGAGVVAEAAPGPFGQALAALLADAGRRAALAEAGRRFAGRYDWRAVAPRLLGAYERAAAVRAGSMRPAT